MQPARLIAAFSLGLCFLFFIGCTRVNEADVPGDYNATADWGNSSLTIAADHTFRQTVRANSGEVKQISGKWNLVKPSGNSANTNITFAPYLNFQHDKQGVYAPWSFLSITPIGIRGLEIAADPDWGITFKKH